MNRRPIVDAHLDLAWNALQWNRDLTRPLAEVRAAEAHVTDHRARGKATVTLPEMRRARVGLCLGTLLARCKPDVSPPAGFNRRNIDFCAESIVHAVARGQLAYYQLLEQQGYVRLIRSSGDLRKHWAAWSQAPDAQPAGLIVAMEGADPIVSPQQAGEWWDLGLRCVGLAHYGQARYAFGSGGEGPLTPAGRELLVELQRLGIIVDLTHCAEPGFHEVLDRFGGRVHASHNACRALVPGDRQYSDEQIRKLIQRDAVIGMPLDGWMLYPGWVTGQTTGEVLSIEAVADHVDHVCQLAGSVRHVGIGSDLDGGFGHEQCPREFHSIADLHKLEPILSARGYSGADLDAIFFGNWLRFFGEALPAD